MRAGTLLLQVLVALPGARAHASGYYLPDAGIVAFGRGGAFVAGADNQFAQYYNPAGLVRVDVPTVNLGWSGVGRSARFTRFDPDGGPMSPVRDTAPPFPVPEFGAVVPLREDLAVAVGFTSPFAPSTRYPADGPQRYSVVDSAIAQGWAGPAVAWRPVPALAVGLGLSWSFVSVRQRTTLTTAGRDDPSRDVHTTFAAADPARFGASFGLLVEPVAPLSIGLAVAPGIRYRARGSVTLDFRDHWTHPVFVPDAEHRDDDVTIAIRLPTVVRGGVAVRPRTGLEIEAAVVWEQWSSMDDLVVDGIHLEIGEAWVIDEPFVVPTGFRDAASFRLGAELAASDRLEVRGGALLETAAQRPRQLSVALVDTTKLLLGSGATARLAGDRLWIDASAAVIGYRPVTIRDSEVRQINPVGDATRVVGNGDYRATAFLVGVGARWRFLPRTDR